MFSLYAQTVISRELEITRLSTLWVEEYSGSTVLSSTVTVCTVALAQLRSTRRIVYMIVYVFCTT
jgi:hypothetical protein